MTIGPDRSDAARQLAGLRRTETRTCVVCGQPFEALVTRDSDTCTPEHYAQKYYQEHRAAVNEKQRQRRQSRRAAGASPGAAPPTVPDTATD